MKKLKTTLFALILCASVSGQIFRVIDTTDYGTQEHVVPITYVADTSLFTTGIYPIYGIEWTDTSGHFIFYAGDHEGVLTTDSPLLFMRLVEKQGRDADSLRIVKEQLTDANHLVSIYEKSYETLANKYNALVNKYNNFVDAVRKLKY